MLKIILFDKKNFDLRHLYAHNHIQFKQWHTYGFY